MKRLKLLIEKMITIRSLIVLLLLVCSYQSRSQGGWEVGMGAGASMPITGYKEVLKSGWLISAEGKYRFDNRKFAVGMETDFVRLQKDNNPSDAFVNARMTIVPIVFTAEYEMNKGARLRPYIVGGLGLSLFNLTYDTSPTEGEAIFNVSFTMSPQLGLRYQASKHVLPFIEAKAVLLADGPPQGFPKGEQLTGYNAIVAGINYQF